MTNQSTGNFDLKTSGTGFLKSDRMLSLTQNIDQIMPIESLDKGSRKGQDFGKMLGREKVMSVRKGQHAN